MTDNVQDTINDPADDWNATDWATQAVVFNSTGLAGVNITGDFTFYLDGTTPVGTLTGQTIDNFGDR